MPDTFNFTKAALDALSVSDTGRRTTYKDAKTRGLQIRVTPGGAKSFSVYRRVKGGRPERITIGKYPAMTIEIARKKAAEINSAIEGGANPAEAKRAHRGERTFNDLFTEYFARHANVRNQTADQDRKRYELHLKASIGNRKISSIDRLTIAAVHNSITKKGHPVQANRVLALASSIYGKAIEWGFTEKNPCLGISRNPEKARDRFLQSAEMELFFAALGAEPNDTIRDYLWVSLLTGVRRSNVLAMCWSDLDRVEGVWRIEQTKNGTPQNVPLSPDVQAILNARSASADLGEKFVFPGSGKTGHLVEPKKGWQRVLSHAKISGLRIHDLRRTLGSWQAKTGASLPVIGKSLNHKSSASTAIYARLDLDPVRASVDRAVDAIMLAGGRREREKDNTSS